MTPTELLEEVKGRFVVLYHNDQAALERLLRQALGKYQDRAGVLLRLDIPEPGAPASLPDIFLAPAVCQDANGRFVPFAVDADNLLRLRPAGGTAWPVTFLWLARLRDWPLDKPLPPGCTGLVGDYLEALIDIPNTARSLSANRALDGPTAELPSAQELKARLTELEQAMEDNRAMLPPVLVVA